ncbi:MAG: hypothetical protein PHO92_04145 [Candidatus Peribacteraceae bacterium]|nr:hypothetical protein [Candidatus Peribacteraceae bacterium]
MSTVEIPQETIPRFEAPESPEEAAALLRILEGNESSWDRLMQVKHEDPQRYEKIRELLERVRGNGVCGKEQCKALERVLQMSGMLRGQVRTGPLAKLRGIVGL